MSRIEELKALMEKATKRTLSYDGCSISDFDTENCMTMEWISNGYEEDEDNGDRERKDADGALFAAAVNALPDLLAVCEAVEYITTKAAESAAHALPGKPSLDKALTMVEAVQISSADIRAIRAALKRLEGER